jgi:cholesterol transport system auxiliary component
MKRRALLGMLAAGLAGCSALPEKPTRQIMYDFGPPPATAAGTSADRPALVLPEVETEGILDTPALLYRLAYEDAFQLRSYAFARWSAPPAQLLRQRLRDVLGRDRAVLDNSAAATLVRRGADRPPVLRVELEELNQVFDAANTSRGVVRVRCTLLQSNTGGDRLVAQRSFQADGPAPSADAPGGVRAVTAAVDAVAADVAAWLRQQR